VRNLLIFSLYKERPRKSMQVNIRQLIDDAQCYDKVRQLRWSEGLRCPFCESEQVVKRGFDDKAPARQRYQCKYCNRRFDDLTGTIFAGRHQPLKVWILCIYFMGLNLSNQQIARELDLNRSDVQQMTSQLREAVKKKTFCNTTGGS
jgi:transposase-like protein